MEKLELEFYKTKKFIFGIFFLILLSFGVIYNEIIRFEFARYEVLSKYDLNNFDTNFFFSRKYYKYARDSLGSNLLALNDDEEFYNRVQIESERFHNQ